MRQVVNYSYDYDYTGQTITYTQEKKKRVKLIPVSSEIKDFMDRRILLNLKKKENDAIKSSLVKDQKKKAGGLFQITIPIKSRTFQSIFGEGGAGLKVSGFRKITFAGRSTWDDKQQSAVNRQSKFPTLNMEQIYRFDISGTIGSKISVKVSQDSRNNLPLANRLILRYKGAEDDILQSIEAGNTTLDLPATQFLKYSTRVQGLFGIKVTAQVADLAITAIASQEKGSTESIEISAGSSTRATITRRDIDYRRRTIFDLGRLPIDRAGSDTIPEDPLSYDFYPGDSIKTAIIYIDRKPSSASDQAGRLSGICYVDPPPHDTLAADPLNEYSVVGEFERVEDADYYFHPTEYYVQFLRPVVQSTHILAVYLEVVRADGSIDKIGDISAESDTLRLKLIKPTSHTKINHHIWEYEWKNVYWLGGSNIDMSELDITIYKGVRSNTNLIDADHPVDQNGINYIQIMGLDDYDESNTARPDGKIDKYTGLIDAALGLLYFPSRHPFDPGRSFTVDGQSGDSIFLNDTVPEIYLSTNNTDVNTSSEYYLAISSRQRGGSTIDLKTSNIIDGSEVVTYNNTRLSKGTDYNIDYDFGTLTLLKDEYSDIDANLSVMFETAPFLSLSKKTLLGTRFQYDRNKDFRIGGTLLYKSDKSTNQKPKIGEETSSMMVWDIDFRFNFENSLINKMIDVMPLLTARAKSYMQISGEIAQSRPNPNVDGEVYIDDFEGAKDSYSLSTYRTSWNFASRPVVSGNSADTISERAQIAWYNPINDAEYNTLSIYNRDQANSNIVRVMKVLFSPVDKIYKDTVEVIGEDTTEVIDSSTYLAPELSWNGFMRYIPSGVTSQLQNAQLLELRVRGDEGILHIDLGRITEDINGDGNLNREDGNNNRILDEGEDTGLDGKFNFEEYAFDELDNPDPSGDNYRAPDEDGFYNINDVWFANGTEDNAEDPDFSSPDTEDRNNNGFEKTNSYFSFKIDLSDTLDYSRGFYVPGTQNENGWKTIRIPVRDPANLDTIIGAPSWTEIMFARLWFDSASVEHIGPENAIELEIAAIDMVSTTWADSLYIADSIRSGDVKFDVAVINDEIDENYVSPPNVSGFEDQATGITEKEQSLLLTYSNLNGGVLVNSPDSGLIIAADTGLAVRKMYRPNNYMGYGKLEAYIHGDADTDGSILYFFRLGFDKYSYYEYRDTLRPGWDNNHMLIDFNEISGLKAKLLNDRAAGLDSSLVRDEGKYRVKIKSSGNDPSLTRIQYFTIGVVNLNPDKPASGELWIDELRLIDVRNDIGMAARVNISGNLADLFNYSFGYSSQDAFYRGVATSTRGGASNNLGSGKTQTTYSFTGKLNLDKFLPRSLGLTLPVNIGWSQSVQEPLLRSNTDIVVPEELREKETSFTISRSIRIAPKFNKQTKNIIFTGLLNRLTTSFSYKVTQGHSPTRPEHFSENYVSSASYQLSISTAPSIKPLFWTGIFKPPWGLAATKLYLLPTRVSLSGTLTGSYSRSRNQTGQNPPSVKRDFKGRVTTRFKIFDNLGGDYSFNTNRNLIDPTTIFLTFNPKKFKLGIEQNYDQSFKATYTPRILGFLTHKFDYSVSYNDRFNLSTDSVYYHNAGRKKNIGVGLKFNHQTLFGTNKRGSSRAGAADSSMFLWKMFRFGRKGFRYITDAIQPVGLKLTYGESRTRPNLSQKAALPFRFGFSDEPGVDEVSATTRGSVRRIHTEDWKLSGSSGVALFSGISATVSFSRNIHETFINSPSKTITVVWPDVTFKLRSIKGLWYFGKVMNFLSPSSGFKRNTEEKRHTLEPFPLQEKERFSFSPLISFSLSPTRSLKTTVRVENSTTKTTKFNESTGIKTVVTRGTVKTYSFNAGFNYRNPNGIKLPLIGRIRFQSTLSISVDVSYRKSRDEEAKPSNDYVFVVTSEKTNLSIRPTMSYGFSNTVKGSLSGRWQDSNDLRTNRKSHTREISVTIELRF